MTKITDTIGLMRDVLGGMTNVNKDQAFALAKFANDLYDELSWIQDISNSDSYGKGGDSPMKRLKQIKQCCDDILKNPTTSKCIFCNKEAGEDTTEYDQPLCDTCSTIYSAGAEDSQNTNL